MAEGLRGVLREMRATTAVPVVRPLGQSKRSKGRRSKRKKSKKQQRAKTLIIRFSAWAYIAAPADQKSHEEIVKITCPEVRTSAKTEQTQVVYPPRSGETDRHHRGPFIPK